MKSTLWQTKYRGNLNVNGAEYGASVAEQKGASRLLKMDS
jgi:hypothetical protein